MSFVFDTPLSPKDIHKIQQRTLRIVMLVQLLGGAGLAAGITVGALIAKDMLGTDSGAGLPTALFTLGSALAAWLVGRSTQSHGRRLGLGVGFFLGGIGAFAVAAATAIDSVYLLFAALFVYGSGTATNLQARYAGTDLASASERGRAISLALVATTLGAVAGPNLVEPLGNLAAYFSLPKLAGPFLLAGSAYLAAGTLLLLLLRPDPLLVARAVTNAQERSSPFADKNHVAGRSHLVFAGAAIMVLIQLVMIAIMTMTPVHMRAHSLSLGDVGLVIGVHIGAMFLPSPITGILVDRLGRTVMAIACVLTLLAAGLIAAVAPGDSMILLISALALLGLGWNFGLISGTALIVDGTPLSDRARTQGSVDVLIALAGASGGALSGVMVAGTSFAALSITGGLLALALLPVLGWSRARSSSPVA